MLEPENGMHPGAAAHALDAEALAAQLFSAFKVRAGDHHVGQLARNGRENFKVWPLSRRSQHGGAARISDLNIASEEARNQDRRAFDEHEPRFDAAFSENALLLSDDQWNGPGTYGRIANGDLRLGPDRRNDREGQPQKQCTNNNSHVRFHEAKPSAATPQPNKKCRKIPL